MPRLLRILTLPLFAAFLSPALCPFPAHAASELSTYKLGTGDVVTIRVPEIGELSNPAQIV